MVGFDKDRSVSRVVGSSVNSQPKKGGAGGQYTWGSPLESAHFEPVGIGSFTNVTTAAPVYLPQPIVVQTAQPFQMATTDFPTLGSPVVAPRTVTTWGGATHQQLIIASAPVAVAPVQLQTETRVRPGSVDLFDSSHPRNTFAKKAYHGSPIPQVELAVSSPMASKLNTSQLCHNHVSPFAPAPPVAPGTKLTKKQLEAIVGPAQTFAPAPRYSSGQVPRQAQKRMIIQQPK
eukprot:TRINITY_DN520_c0_g1_i1.p1 TRINITY_DN520_c0_g1~~TRINITY_DN520_c0_g1_i1.p1  ORF type:complete len:232 (+),score=31.83 TRINITY_DN520_c0_g1_i1:81-776(+)